MEKPCADIGTVHASNQLDAVFGEENVEFEYLLGKYAITDPSTCDLVVHCEECMLNSQQARWCSNGNPQIIGCSSRAYSVLEPLRVF